ncbi:hypothetical protein [Mongoliitalea daihaiensis]|uniref:hypothetical protein n=1 Tax=Mongoliitalea daihaiensis TaxID=2782006 RepID=UPI001F2E376F|nr:hypothetical protein [Mongoliitalea daihaiensis]UJP66443.1 hypothetical protein IPZ59_07540 [Mongoliitalea daihaiensis]
MKSFSWLAVLLLTSIFVLSCIPEDSESLLKKESKEIVDSEILFAKEWFETNKTNLVNNQSWQSARLNLVNFDENDFQAIWENSQKYHFRNGRKAVEVPVKDATIIFPKAFKEDWTDVDVRTVVQTNLLLLENHSKDGFFPYLIRYYPTKSTGKFSADDLNYSNLGKKWKGKISIYSLNGFLLQSFDVEESKVIITIKSSISDVSFRFANQSNGCTLTSTVICTTSMAPADYPKDLPDAGVLLPQYEVTCTTIFDWSCPPPINLGSPGDNGSGGFGGGGNNGPTPEGDEKLCEPLFEDCIPFPGDELTPDFPDEQIIKDPSFEDTTADCIYEKLKSIDGFKELASKFEGLGTEFDVVLKIGATRDPTTNGQAWWRGPFEPIEITFNEAKMNRSALEVARTIIHEMIHAELYRALNTQNPTNSDLSFKETFEDYTRQFIGDNDSHHNYMADYWVDKMADILERIHPQLGYSELNNFLSSWAYPSGIPKDFYKALAWDGLKYENVRGWKNKTTDEKDEINSHIDKAKYGTNSCN